MGLCDYVYIILFTISAASLVMIFKIWFKIGRDKEDKLGGIIILDEENGTIHVDIKADLTEKRTISLAVTRGEVSTKNTSPQSIYYKSNE